MNSLLTTPLWGAVLYFIHKVGAQRGYVTFSPYQGGSRAGEKPTATLHSSVGVHTPSLPLIPAGLSLPDFSSSATERMVPLQDSTVVDAHNSQGPDLPSPKPRATMYLSGAMNDMLCKVRTMLPWINFCFPLVKDFQPVRFPTGSSRLNRTTSAPAEQVWLVPFYRWGYLSSKRGSDLPRAIVIICHSQDWQQGSLPHSLFPTLDTSRPQKVNQILSPHIGSNVKPTEFSKELCAQAHLLWNNYRW